MVVVECVGDVGVGARTAGLVWGGQRAFRSSKLEARLAGRREAHGVGVGLSGRAVGGSSSHAGLKALTLQT